MSKLTDISKTFFVSKDDLYNLLYKYVYAEASFYEVREDAEYMTENAEELLDRLGEFDLEKDFTEDEAESFQMYKKEMEI